MSTLCFLVNVVHYLSLLLSFLGGRNHFGGGEGLISETILWIFASGIFLVPKFLDCEFLCIFHTRKELLLS